MNRTSSPAGAFTLLELLASMAILALMMVMLFSAFNLASKAWLQGENRVETFQQARAALDFISKELSQAIVTTNVPFLANFNSLAFVSPSSDSPSDGTDLMKIVYRLNYQQIGAPDPNGIFSDNVAPQKLARRASAYSSTTGNCWDYGLGVSCSSLPWNFYDFSATKNWPETSDYTKTAVLAENIVSLVFDFQDSLGRYTNYWNSTTGTGIRPWDKEILGLSPGLGDAYGIMSNRAPIAVQITIGAIDSRAAKRIKALLLTSSPYTNSANVGAYLRILNEATQYFTTTVSIPNRQP